MPVLLSLSLLMTNLVLVILFIFLYRKLNTIQNKLQSIEELAFSFQNLPDNRNKLSQSPQSYNMNLYDKSEDEDIANILLNTISNEEENSKDYSQNNFKVKEIDDEVINNLLKHSKLKVEKEKLKNLLMEGDLESISRILKLTLSEVKIILYNQR